MMWLLRSGKKGSGPIGGADDPSLAISFALSLPGTPPWPVLPSSFSCPPRVTIPGMYHLFRYPVDVKNLRILAKLPVPDMRIIKTKDVST